MSVSLVWFVSAALFEIAGCFAFWVPLRPDGSPFLMLVGTASLVAFAAALTRVGTVFAGRAYTAYGGIYIAASLCGSGSLRGSGRQRRIWWAHPSPSSARL